MKRILLLVLLLSAIFFFNGAQKAFAAYALDVDDINFIPKDLDASVALSYPTTLLMVFTDTVDLAELHTDLNPYSGWRITIKEVVTGLDVLLPLKDSYLTTSDNKTWLITLPVQLKRNTQYRVTLSGAIKSGLNYLRDGAGYTYTFTTVNTPDVEPPNVISTLPVNGSTQIPVSSTISVQFSEVMLADASANAADNVSNYTINNGASFSSVSYDNLTNTATLTTSALMSQNTTYTVTAKGNLKDLAGNAMGADYGFSFQTFVPDTGRPTVLSVTPAGGSTSVVPTTDIVIVFSEEMDPATITTSTVYLTPAVAGVVAYNTTGSKTATFTPSSALNFSTNYTVTITNGVKDLAGNSMLNNKTSTFTTSQSLSLAPMNNYCQIPPFLGGANVRPNVLLMVDNSGSMAEFAYKTSGKGGGTGSNADTSYNPAMKYDGYFNSELMYKYTGNPSNGNGNFEVDANKTLDKSSFWSGNFLNWLIMRRVDMVRKVLVGGKTSPRSANTANYLIPLESPDRDYYKTFTTTEGANYKFFQVDGDIVRTCKTSACTEYYQVLGTKVYVGNQPPQEGLILQYETKLRMGIMFFNDSGRKYEDSANGEKDGGNVAVKIGSTGTNLITQIENTNPGTWTPLAEALYEGTRYFQAITGAYTNQNYGAASWDPIENACASNFVVVLTDGESTKDKNLPNSYWTKTGKVTDPYGAQGLDIKVWMDKITANEGGPTNYYTTAANSSDGTYYLAGVAYYAHNTDLRTATMGNSNIVGKQNLTIYTVFAFDDSQIGRNLLKLAAKYGGYQDSNNDGIPQAGEWDSKVSGIPDNYYEATGGSNLGSTLGEVLNDIMKQVSSGTAASILNNSEGSGASLMQAVFYPEKSFANNTKATWIGEMQNLWYYLDPSLQYNSVRVDTARPYVLSLLEDYIADFYYDVSDKETKVLLSRDLTGKGQSFAAVNTYPPDDLTHVKSLWRAGHKLWQRNLNADPRRIFTRTGLPALDTVLNSSSEPTGLAYFDSSIEGNSAVINSLQAANSTESSKIINYVSGIDQPSYRNRTVTIDAATGVWKLGDIVSSTPKIQGNVGLNNYNQQPPTGYADTSYDRYANSNDYRNRGMVYVGGNDGMLHAFRLGVLKELTDPCRQLLPGSNSTTCFADKAKVNNYDTLVTPLSRYGENANITAATTDDLGREEWAFIPSHMMPYLKYLGDPAYSHLFYVDGPSLLIDLPIATPLLTTMPEITAYPLCSGSYWECPKQTRYTSIGGNQTNNIDFTRTSWRTILIGSTGLGGASRNRTVACAGAGTDCVKTPVDGLGYSSYFALDVTRPTEPKFLWEFAGDTTNGGNLGYATSGPLIVRVGNRTDKNGRWFAVFASGPTGPIDTGSHQFLGRSDQNLRLFVVDIGTGALVKTIDTGITNAFAGSISNSAIDTDRSNRSSTGYYQDDAIYIGYTQKDNALGTWTNGGVIRLLTNENSDPSTWVASSVLQGIGPVTTAVSKLQDRGNKNLWLYFGTGRYFYKTETTLDDDSLTVQRELFGVMEPCYNPNTQDITPNCSSSASYTSLKDQTATPGAPLGINDKGWRITLDIADTSNSLERLITDPVASPSGVVFFPTFKPTKDVCGFGGNSQIWAVDYATGGVPRANAMKGTIMMQVSTGAFVQVAMSTAFSEKGGRRTAAIAGVPPKAQGLSLLANPKPIKKILQIQEK